MHFGGTAAAPVQGTVDGAEQLTRFYADVLEKMRHPRAHALIKETLNIFRDAPSAAGTEDLDGAGMRAAGWLRASSPGSAGSSASRCLFAGRRARSGSHGRASDGAVAIGSLDWVRGGSGGFLSRQPTRSTRSAGALFARAGSGYGRGLQGSGQLESGNLWRSEASSTQAGRVQECEGRCSSAEDAAEHAEPCEHSGGADSRSDVHMGQAHVAVGSAVIRPNVPAGDAAVAGASVRSGSRGSASGGGTAVGETAATPHAHAVSATLGQGTAEEAMTGCAWGNSPAVITHACPCGDDGMPRGPVAPASPASPDSQGAEGLWQDTGGAQSACGRDMHAEPNAPQECIDLTPEAPPCVERAWSSSSTGDLRNRNVSSGAETVSGPLAGTQCGSGDTGMQQGTRRGVAASDRRADSTAGVNAVDVNAVNAVNAVGNGSRACATPGSEAPGLAPIGACSAAAVQPRHGSVAVSSSRGEPASTCGPPVPPDSVSPTVGEAPWRDSGPGAAVLCAGQPPPCSVAPPCTPADAAKHASGMPMPGAPDAGAAATCCAPDLDICVSVDNCLAHLCCSCDGGRLCSRIEIISIS